MIPSLPPADAFEWLEEGLSPPSGAYLRLLGPGGGERGERVLANLVTVAGRLRERPGYWRDLIRTRNWRYTLVGCSAVSLSHDPRFLDDLLSRFKEGSWVAPQLAVTLGLVHPAEARAELEGLIRDHGASPDQKTTFAAYAALKRLGSPASLEFESDEPFRRSQVESPGITSPPAYHGLLAIRIVDHHWDFWSKRGLA